MPSCAVQGCKSSNMREGHERNIRFFTFPKDEDMRELWTMACNRPNVNWTHARICSLHFTEDDWCLKDKLLNTDTAKCSLDKKAIPSLYLPIEMPAVKHKIRFDDRVKPKNVLALNEKVAAIRRFEANPVYTTVSRYFNCSQDQIKRIIKQKDEILAEWNKRTKKTQVNLTREIKSVKVSFLGKAVHEWIRRMMYYSDFNLTDALIQTMAIEFKKALDLPNFFPDKAWVASFRKTYNLKEVSTKTLGIGYQESLSVQIWDIVSYLNSICGSSEVAPEAEASTPVPKVDDTVGTEHKYCKSPPRNAAKYESHSCAPSTSTAVISERRKSTPAPATQQTEPPACIKSEPEEPTSIKMETEEKVITYAQAMHCVKQLEEFALMRENFRLIGLVERLEEALQEEDVIEIV